MQLTTELKDVDRAIEELRQRKADLDGRLQKTTIAEKELRAKSAPDSFYLALGLPFYAVERVDQKVASIGEESARFERSIRHITVPGKNFLLASRVLNWTQSLREAPPTRPRKQVQIRPARRCVATATL